MSDQFFSGYIISTSNGFQITIACNLNIPKPSSTCTSEIFYINIDFNSNLLGSEYFCGTGSVSRMSIFNKAVLAYTSSSRVLGGYFSCVVTATSTQAPCDCGWSKTVSIV